MDVNILFSIAAILTTDGEKKHEEATYTLNPFDSPSVSVTILIEEMTPLSTQTVTEADVTLIGESFDDVTLVSQDGQFSFSVLYISKVLGVIGFRDRSNELWVLKR